MKRILLALVLIAATFAWNNPAWPEVLEARYAYDECNVGFAKDFVELREDCAEDEDVPIFDSSEYVEDIDDNLEDLEEAAEDDDRLEFGLTRLALAGDLLELGLAIVGDAFDNKTAGFFDCVQDGKDALKDDLEDCRVDALAEAEAATAHFVEYDIEHAEDITEDLEEDGVDVSGMEAVIEDGEELLDDIPEAFDEDEPAEVRALQLRHSRLVDLFHLERMSAICEYAVPILEDGDYDEDIIDDVESLNEDIRDTIDECEYSAEVENNNDYANQNLDCWADTWDHYEDFVSLKTEILFG
ncbi:hypothetical protein GF412_01290 [Candidatus Micrarchaeota archaeon]|nr:hypothetical protein [Candidatus Micrarchaeota archaeon]MBD3417605.1 hypothetical protein [Candidatus Micrarchaeota archaeon]